MRIIKRDTTTEKQVICRQCNSLIGYYPCEVTLEWVQNPFDEYDGRYIRYVRCPVCHEDIILIPPKSSK